MKLFLHWLRWDLCRFRFMLGAWTLLVFGYAIFLGWLQVHLLTGEIDLLHLSSSIAGILFLTSLGMLFHLFSTDAADGPHQFWKTRPPHGVAVAASKWVIALGFFIALPLIAWLTMDALTQWPGAGTQRWQGHSWAWFLWIVQVALVSAFALAAAGAGRPWRIPLHLIMGLGGAVSLWICFFAWSGMAPDTLGLLMETCRESLFTPLVSGLCLLAGGGVYLAARIRRTPGRWVVLLTASVPALLLSLCCILEKRGKISAVQPELKVVEPLAASSIQVGKVPLRSSGMFMSRLDLDIDRKGYDPNNYTIYLKVAGLPVDTIASGRWLDLSLITADGRVAAIDSERSQQFAYPQTSLPGSSFVPVGNAVFPAGSLAPLSLLPCRAEGRMRLVIHRKRTSLQSLEKGGQIDLPVGSFQVTGIGGYTSDPNSPTFELPAVWRHPISPVTFSLNHVNSNTVLRLAKTDPIGIGAAFLLKNFRVDCGLRVDRDNPVLPHCRFRRDLRERTLTKHWQLGFNWYEPVATVDLPVEIDQVVVPVSYPYHWGKSDWEAIPDIISALEVGPETTAVELGRTLKYAATLVGNYLGPIYKGVPQGGGDLQFWHDLLAKVPRGHLKVLLDLVTDDPPADQTDEQSFDRPLKKRIVELLEPADLPGIRRNPVLFAYLEKAMAERNLIPAPVNEPVAPEAMGDEPLEQRWRESIGTRTLDLAVLRVAASRGLPWVLPPTHELTTFLPASREAYEVWGILSEWSDCPQERKAGIPWLAANALNLKWDPAAKRWVLPPAP